MVSQLARKTTLRQDTFPPSRAEQLPDSFAAGYDASCRHIERIRQDAVDSLRLRPGETVFDIACGTGNTILPMAESVGPSGHVVGVELVPEMAAITCGKLVALGFDDRAAVHVSAAEDFTTDLCADAMLFCYTHDVLQSPQAIANLLRHAQPGCRIAVVG